MKIFFKELQTARMMMRLPHIFIWQLNSTFLICITIDDLLFFVLFILYAHQPTLVEGIKHSVEAFNSSKTSYVYADHFHVRSGGGSLRDFVIFSVLLMFSTFSHTFRTLMRFFMWTSSILNFAHGTMGTFKFPPF